MSQPTEPVTPAPAPAADGGAGPATVTAPAGQVPPPDPSHGPDRETALAQFVSPPAGAPGGSGDIAPGAGSSGPTTGQAAADSAGDPAGQPARTGPGDRTLDALPPDIRDYIGTLRSEAAENRVRAREAEQAAAERFEQQRQEWIGKLLQEFGLIADVSGEPAAQLTPEEQITHLTEQLGQTRQEREARDQAYRELLVEHAVWRAADEYDADPQRLTDSRRFMARVAELDPDADDFRDQLADAIADEVEANAHYKRQQAAPAAPPPPVPSGGEFAAGPRRTGPALETVDDFRADIRRRRGVDVPGR